MLPDKIIEPGSLRIDGRRVGLSLRMPWYRALPLSSVADLTWTIDDVPVPRESITWTVNDQTYALDDLPPRHDQWWYVLEPVSIEGDLPSGLSSDAEGIDTHDVGVVLDLFIPYITTDFGVLKISETDRKRLTVEVSAERRASGSSGPDPAWTTKRGTVDGRDHSHLLVPSAWRKAGSSGPERARGTDEQTTLGTPVQGVTLYSFTRAFHARQYSFAELVREVAARGLGPGLELVGFQSIRDFPQPDPAFVDEFRDLIDETGLVPTALAANADASLRRDRMLSSDELVEYMRPQIALAAELGFPVVRVQISLTPDDMERLLPIAEHFGVRLGLEIHSHQHPKHPNIQALLERYEKLGSPFLGFTPDWGATLRAVPATLLRRYRRDGVDEELLTGLDRLWHEHHADGPPMTEAQHGRWFGSVIQLAHQYGAADRAVEMAVNLAGLFGHAPVADWADVLGWTVHTHGKFYEIDEHGNEPTVPIAEILDLWVKSGYSQAISSEWEGFHWNDWADPFEVVAAQQALIRHSAEAAGSHSVTDPEQARLLLSPTTMRTPA